MDQNNGIIPDPDVPGAFVVRVGGADQSWLDPADPTRLEFDYVQRIAAHVDAHAPAGERLRVVHIGGAGMTLARYVAHTRPTSPQIVCEPDEQLTAAVRERAPLPRNSGVKVRPVDGRTGLAAMPDDYADLIIVDAFVGMVVPAGLVSVEAFAEYRRVLHTGGTVVLNVTDKLPFDWTRRVLAALRLYFPHRTMSAEPSTLRGRRKGNLVIAGSTAPLPVDDLAREASRAVFSYRLMSGDVLDSMIGGAQPMHDATAQDSPHNPADNAYWFG
ncbi:spermidine synthase [Propionibacteriaceae bacterium G57]|uniref:spermidine synthase n=1 Tax=Aestuariimicrobium sp. G57 TaxID=3418485 RepID=UPI003DA754FD